jgi:tricorn protease
MPSPVSGAKIREAAVSHDGSCIAYIRGGVSWWRKGYRGSAETKIWLCRPATSRFGPLVEEPGNHRWPMWGAQDKTLYFASDADGITNLWKLDLTSMEKEKRTDFREFGVRFPVISGNGKVITFSSGADLYALDTAGGPPRPIKVRAPLDARRGPLEHRSFTADVQDFALPPEGKDFAFVVHGEVFALPLPPSQKDAEGGPPVEKRANRLTRSPFREKDITFSPDGETVVFASDRNGNYDLFLVRSADPKEKNLSGTLKTETVPLVRGPEDETRPAFSPDGKFLAFKRGRGNLVVIDLEGTKETTVLRGWNLSSFRWSPDGRWFVFARQDDEYNSDVFVCPADGSKEPINLSRHPDDDRSPVWFPNGRAIAFVSRRNNDDDDVWMVFLRKKDWELAPDALWAVWTGEDEEEEEEEEKKKKPPPEVKIDREEIHLRLRQLTSLPGDETGAAVSPDSLTVAFFAVSGGQRGFWTVQWDGGVLERVSQNVTPEGGMIWGPGGKEVFYIGKGGKVKAIAKKGGKKRTLSFQAEMEIDALATRRQMFHEAWRLMDRNFYDPAFHGADWNAMREKYKPVALAASCPEDFCDAVKMMLGEINASHLGIYPPGRGGGKDETGVLGVDFDLEAPGPGLTVASVLRESPASREESRLNAGDVILTVGGVAQGASVNLYRALNQTKGQRILLTVARGGNREDVREVVIRPYSVSGEWRGRYETLIRERRERVDAWSQGRFAYLHIRGMGWHSFERFERELYSVAHGRDGLVLDVRDNGGGWTADMVLAVLSVKPHAVTQSRGGGRGYPQGRRPFYVWTKPAALLCNQWSFSNAEILSHAFKTLKRGPLVGRPTYGGVISTGGRRLLDGSWIRMPTRGWWVGPKGPDMELNGAAPDHDVPVTPTDEEKGLDPQLKKAVEVLLERLVKNAGKQPPGEEEEGE